MQVTRALLPALGSAMFLLGLAPAASRPPALTLTHPFPSVVRMGALVTVQGRAQGVAQDSRAALEIRRTASWKVLATASLAPRGTFLLRWRVAAQSIGPVSLRVAAIHRGRVLAASAPVHAAIGPAPVYCAAPVSPAVDIPAGDGWIVGGVYLEGGPFPGIYACESQRYTITVRTGAGATVATQTVAGGHSYTVVVRAGTYDLRAMPCGFGSVVVQAGKQTVADAVCPLP